MNIDAEIIGAFVGVAGSCALWIAALSVKALLSSNGKSGKTQALSVDDVRRAVGSEDASYRGGVKDRFAAVEKRLDSGDERMTRIEDKIENVYSKIVDRLHETEKTLIAKISEMVKKN